MTELEPIFARLGIVHYLQNFIQEGFDTWETVLDITESDLDALKVKLGHRRRLQREIANARGINFDQLITRGISNEDEVVDDRYEARTSESKASGGTSGKRKYRRHPKPDENAPDRAPSAYVIFSNRIREDLKPLNLSFTEIAKRVGESWQVLSPEEKETYESQAAALKERFTVDLAEYKKTRSYHEYAAYLADFKAKNSNFGDGKRPRLENRLSPVAGGSSESYETTGARSVSRVDSASSATTHSSVSGHVSPKSMATSMSKGLPLGDSSVSPASLPPTPPLQHKAPRVARANKGVAKDRPVTESSSYQNGVPARRPPLPRIIPPEIGNDSAMMLGILPPLVTDAAVLHNSDTSRANARRSQNSPAPFLGHGKSKSSGFSSRSSDVSGSSVAGSSLFTPITPNDDSGSQRNILLPLPSSIPSNPINAPPYTDSNQQVLHSTGLPQSPQKYTALPLLQSPYAPSLREPSSGSTLDIFNELDERHSMRNLSLGNSSQVPGHHLRSYSRELQEAQRKQEHPLLPPRQTQPLPHDISRASANSGKEYRTFHRPKGSVLEAPPDPQADPLSVLAYVGRMVDLESRKPP